VLIGTHIQVHHQDQIYVVVVLPQLPQVYGSMVLDIITGLVGEVMVDQQVDVMHVVDNHTYTSAPSGSNLCSRGTATSVSVVYGSYYHWSCR